MTRLLSCALIGLVVGIAAILPFDVATKAAPELAQIPIVGSVAGLLGVVGSAAAFYNVLTVNAFNAWVFVGPQPLTGALDANLFWTFDSLQVIGPITAAQLGAAMFLALTLLAVVVLLRQDDRRTMLLAFTLIAFAFFALPTRVHERYLFPVFATGALIAATSIRWRWWFIALSIANTANLHAIATLPFEGYATAGLRGLPLGDVLREPIVVGLIADAHMVLFVLLLAYFVRRVAWPAFRRRPPEHAGSAQGSSPTVRPVMPGPSPSDRRPRPWVSAIRRVGNATTRRVAGPTAPRRVDPLAFEGPGRLDRRDLAIIVVLFAVVLGTRWFGLRCPGRCTSMSGGTRHPEPSSFKPGGTDQARTDRDHAPARRQVRDGRRARRIRQQRRHPPCRAGGAGPRRGV